MNWTPACLHCNFPMRLYCKNENKQNEQTGFICQNTKNKKNHPNGKLISKSISNFIWNKITKKFVHKCKIKIHTKSIYFKKLSATSKELYELKSNNIFKILSTHSTNSDNVYKVRCTNIGCKSIGFVIKCNKEDDIFKLLNKYDVYKYKYKRQPRINNLLDIGLTKCHCH